MPTPHNIRAPQGERGTIANPWLEVEEPAIVRHPHSQDLVELAIDELLGERALLGATRSLPQLGRKLVDDRVVDTGKVLGGLGVHELIRALVQPDRMTRLESPRNAVPFAIDVTAIVRGVVQLGDLDIDVVVLLQVLLDELDLRGHLGEILVVEEGRLEPVRVTSLDQ